jgi:hypothetical protein
MLGVLACMRARSVIESWLGVAEVGDRLLSPGTEVTIQL